MNRLAASGRADLLRELRDGRLSPLTAALFHFAPVPVKAADPVPEGWEPAPAGTPLPSAQLPPTPAPDFPCERPRLALLRAETVESLAPLPPPPADDPVGEQELAVDWTRTGVVHRPLVRWSRLAGWLRQRLGAVVPGAVLDLRALLWRVTHGQPVLSLPRRCRPVWAAQALILWDDTPELRPFRPDLGWLERRLERERGRHGLRVLQLDGLLPSGKVRRAFLRRTRSRSAGGPAPVPPQDVALRAPAKPDHVLAHLAPGCPVLALSAMGQFNGEPHTRAAWLALGRRLRWQGHPLQAFSPCPRRQWDATLAAVWPQAVWDRGTRLPRRAGARPGPVPAPEPTAAVEELLNLLAPAARVSPALLRAARFHQATPADAGVEWCAWFHSAGWHSTDCFGFKPGPDLAARLTRRREWTAPLAAAAAQVAELIRADHAAHGLAIAQATDLRLALTAPGAETDPLTFGDFLGRVVDRLRRLAAAGQPLSTLRRTDELPRWFRRLVATLSPDLRAHPAVAEQLAQGLALTDALERPEQVEVAEGIDLAAYAAESQALPGRTLVEAAAWQVELAPDEAGTRFALRPPAAAAPPRRVPLAQLPVAPGPLLVQLRPQPGQRFQVDAAPSPLGLPLVATSPIVVTSAYGRLTLEPFTRPAWARRMWQDRFGLAAEFLVGAVPFVLRWIPPGRLLMGSPDDEPGRDNDEGPQHEVTISCGFWLGETPVTQAQWRAVVEATPPTGDLLRSLGIKRNQGLNPSPSHFKGPGDLPVESVTWDESGQFCRLFNALVKDGPGLRLPSEAEWEYACRAGSTTALYTGPLTLRGENDGPELDPIAWYGGNSGLKLEVTNPYASLDWPKKQHEHRQAGTHRVKQKRANDWGLYDTLGNVWEWCADAWGNYTAETQRDPFRDGRQDAHRGVRGGSWGSRARGCRAAFRDVWRPGIRLRYLGFRLAAGLELRAAEPPLGAERPSRRSGAGAEGRSPEAGRRGAAGER